MHCGTDVTVCRPAALLNLLQDNSAALEAAAVQRNWASATWLQSLYLLCQRLGGPWRTDWAVCLSALEVLAGLAKVGTHTLHFLSSFLSRLLSYFLFYFLSYFLWPQVEVSTDVSDRQGVLEAVCGYIEYQCGRPPTLHSRDLHSVIVAAFHCLSVWITQHATLLDRQVTCTSWLGTR